MATLTDFLVRLGTVKIPLEINYHVDTVDDPEAVYWTVDLVFEDEEQEDWVLNGEPVSGIGETVEEAMAGFMDCLADFAAIEDYKMEKKKDLR